MADTKTPEVTPPATVPAAPAPAAPVETGPVTAPREGVLSLRGDDRGAAPADHERSISLAEANAGFFATVAAHQDAEAKISREVAKAVAAAVKKAI